MANQDYIGLLADGWEKEIRSAETLVKNLVAQVVQLNNDLKAISAQVGSGGGNVVDTVRLTKELAAAQEALRKTVAELAKAQAQLTSAQNSQRTQTDELTRLKEKLARAQSQEAVEAAKLTNAINAQNAANRAAAQAATAEEGSLTALRAKLRELTTAYDNLSKVERENLQIGGRIQGNINDITRELNEAEQATGRFGRNVGNYASAFNPLQNAITQLTREAPAFANSIQTGIMAISNNVGTLQDAIKQIIAQNAALRAEGKPTVSVFRQLVSGLFSWGTALSLGITLLTVFAKEIGEWGASLFKSKSALADLAQQQQVNNEIQKEAAKGYASEVVHLEALKRQILSEKLTREERVKAVEDYNEVADKSNRIDVAMIDNSSYVEAAITRQIALIKSRALARAAENAIAKRAESLLDKQLELEERFPEQGEGAKGKILQRAKALVGENAAELMAMSELPADQRRKMAAGRTKFKALADEDTVKKLQILQAQNKKIEQYRKNEFGGKGGLAVLMDDIADEQSSLDNAIKAASPYLETPGALSQRDKSKDKKTKPKKTPKPDDLTNELLAAAKKEAEANAKANAFAIQQNLETQKRIYEDETESYEKRLQAANSYNSQRQNQIQAEQKGEINSIEISLNKIAEIKAKGSKPTKEEANLLINERALLAQRREIRERYAAEEEKANREGLMRLQGVTDSEYKRRKAALDVFLADLAEATSVGVNEETLALAKKYAAGEINERAYHEGIRAIQIQFRDFELTDALSAIDEEIAARKAANQEIVDLEKKRADLLKKIKENQTKDGIQQAEKQVTDEREKIQQRLELARTAQQAFNEIASLSGAFASARIAQLDAESEATKNKYDREIAQINNTLLTEEQKKERIAQLNEEAFQEEQLLENKRKEEKRRQAQFEKDLAIANIIINTALAVTAALTSGLPTATFDAIARGALGAVQLAVALATPIPQYAKGVYDDKEHPGGPAWVGDGGVSEYAVYPDGSIYKTRNTPTLVDLPRGTQVFPDAATFLARYTPKLTSFAAIPVPESNRGLEREMRRQTALLEKIAIKPVSRPRLERDAYMNKRMHG